MNKTQQKVVTDLEALGLKLIEWAKMQNEIRISAEEFYDDIVLDYYDGYMLENHPFGIDAKIHAILDEHGMHAEWINPGEVGVYA